MGRRYTVLGTGAATTSPHPDGPWRKRRLRGTHDLMHRPLRPSFALSLVAATSLLVVAGGALAQHTTPLVSVSDITFTVGREPLDNAWLRSRTSQLGPVVRERCYAPAFTPEDATAGVLEVRMSLVRTGRLTGVRVRRAPGGSLPAAVARCVQRELARTRLDVRRRPSGTPIDDSDVEVALDGQPPELQRPIRITLRLTLSAASAAPAPSSGSGVAIPATE